MISLRLAGPYHHRVRRLPQWIATLPPRAQDITLALALTVVDLAALIPYRAGLHPFWLALTMVTFETLPLAARRAFPVATLVVSGAFRVAYDVLGFTFAPLPLGPAIAYFTVIERCPPRTRRVTTGLVAVGLIISQLSPGHQEPYDATVAALIFVTAGMAGVLSRTRRSSLVEAQDRAARAEAEREAKAALTAAAERARIARELHDVVAHHVSLMAVQAEAATSLLPGSPAPAARSVEIIAATARQALTELRRLLGVLRGPGESPPTAPAATLADVTTLLDQVRAAGLAVDYAEGGPAAPLGPATDLTAYRIIQEALTNVLRHARSPRALVEVCYEPGFVTVQVSDAGPGPWSGPAPDSPVVMRSGLGLAGITERVVSCGGTLTVGPADGGFRVRARLPVS
jgi:signal transduction histidine kinase